MRGSPERRSTWVIGGALAVAGLAAAVLAYPAGRRSAAQTAGIGKQEQ